MRRVDPRSVLAGLLGLAVLLCAATAASAREIVPFGAGYEAGTVVVKTGECKLYFVLGEGRAIRHPVAVGMPGRTWAGENTIARKEVDPTWQPPDEVRRDKPHLPKLIPPGPSNPLGPRALVLAWGHYAIHGTNKPSSIGTRASYGCIRMFNEHVVDLFDRVSVGTRVVVLC